MIDLTGQVAFISGGGFIGREIAANVARAGGQLFIADVDSEALADARNAVQREVPDAKVKVGTFDLRQPDSIRAIVDQAIAAYGKIDALVNVVGAFESAPVLKSSPEQWDRIFTVNVRGTFHLLQSVAAKMAESGGGKIVSISSSDGFLAEIPYVAYNASKAAIISFTRTAAIELGPQGITVNVICPGLVYPAGLEDHPRVVAISKRTALRRTATPRNIADGVLFLCSPMAEYITGEVLVIDGGLTIDGTIYEANQFLAELPEMNPFLEEAAALS